MPRRSASRSALGSVRTDGAHGKDEHDGGKEQKDQERGGALPRLTACEQKKSL